MSNIKHTPEPWANGNAKLKADGADIILDYGHYRAHIGRIISIGENDEKIAARIVSCVNAMSGIEDPAKLRQAWEACKELELDAYHNLKAKHDELEQRASNLEAALLRVRQSGALSPHGSLYKAISEALGY